MANFLEALGQSQAITNTISGIQGMKQQELAIQNSKMQQAINEHTYKKMQAEEEAANRLIPVDPILSQLTPSVKKFWEDTGQAYFQQGASGGKYVRQKDLPTIQGLMKDENFNLHTNKLFIDDLTAQEQEIQNKIKQMSQPDVEGGKPPAPNEKVAQELQQQLTDIQKKKIAADQMYDALGRKKKEREDYTLSQGETRFSGTGEVIARGGEKPPTLPYKIGERQKFTGKDGKSYEGTFKGLNPDTNEPIFENLNQVEEKPLVEVTNRQESAESQAVGKYYGEQYSKWQDAGLSAQKNINQMNQLNSYLDNVNTGKIKPLTTTIAGYAKSFGINIDPSLPYAEAARALTNQFALELRNPSGGAGMPGALSDKDREFLLQATANISNTPPSNKLIINARKKLAERDIEIARKSREYRKKHGTINEDFFTELEKSYNNTSMFKIPKGAVLIPDKTTKDGLPVYKLLNNTLWTPD